MYREEIIGIILAVLSIILTILGYLWNIEVWKFIFTYLSGVFTTYVIQHRLQIESEKRKIKRENNIAMRDEIYGPIFERLSEILESIKSVQHLDLGMPENLEGVMTHYQFFKIEQDLRNKLSEILDRVEKYLSIRHATEVMLRDIIRKEIEKAYHIDIGTNMNAPHLSLLVGKVHVAWISLMKTLFRNIEPREFLRRETEKWGEDTIIEVSIGGKKGDLSDFESMYKTVLQEAEKEYLYREEKEQRARLVGVLEAFLEQIKVFVNIE